MTGHHDHGHDGGHRHPHQPDIEDRPFEYYQVMAEAVGELLIEKGVLSAGELRRAIEDLDARSPALGARVVARAWVDPDFKARLLENANAAAAELGIDAGAIPIRALESTGKLHHVVCCTLCSCYPRLLLGVPPDWYKSRAYRSRVVREPRAVLAEFGTRHCRRRRGPRARQHGRSALPGPAGAPGRQRGAARGAAGGAGDP